MPERMNKFDFTRVREREREREREWGAGVSRQPSLNRILSQASHVSVAIFLAVHVTSRERYYYPSSAKANSIYNSLGFNVLYLTLLTLVL